jgi:hypothetical protein
MSDYDQDNYIQDDGNLEIVDTVVDYGNGIV